MVDIIKKKIFMDVISLGWAATLALFSWSIAMVIWGRNGF
jgi:cytochrome b6-f complex subunit 8